MTRGITLAIIATLGAGARPDQRDGPGRATASVSMPAIEPTLTTYKSAHYTIETDVTPDLAGRIAAHMDTAYADYANRFSGYRVRSGTPLKLWVFEHQEDYLVFLAEQGYNGRGTGGVFFVGHSNAGLATFIGSRDTDTVLETLRHEGLHQFVHERITDTMPQWCNEGLAEYFGYAVETEDGIEPGIADPRAIARLQEAVRDNAHMPLDELLFLTNREWSERVNGGVGARAMYDQAWCVVHFLVNAENGKYEHLLLDFIRASWQGLDAPQAAARVFSRDLAPMEEAWKTYVLAMQPDPLLVASDRLHAVARATLHVTKQGETVRTVKQLETAAKTTRFEAKIRTIDGEIEVSGEATWWLEMPASLRGEEAVLRIKPGRGDEAMPSVEVIGLRRRLAVEWIDSDMGYRIIVK